MVNIEDINTILSTRKNRVLSYAELAMPHSQFKVFRKLFLDEFGNSGFLAELDRLIADSSHSQERHGTGRNKLRKNGGVP